MEEAVGQLSSVKVVHTMSEMTNKSQNSPSKPSKPPLWQITQTTGRSNNDSAGKDVELCLWPPQSEPAIKRTTEGGGGMSSPTACNSNRATR